MSKKNIAPTLKVYIGISASGKSTQAEIELKKNPDTVRISRDGFRYEWRNSGVVTPKMEDLITVEVKRQIRMFLNRGFNVIYDATNLQPSYLHSLTYEFNAIANIEFCVFNVELKEAIVRDAARIRSVGAEVIKKQFEAFKQLKGSFDFSYRPKLTNRYAPPLTNSALPSCICFDIDGTLAHMYGRSPFEWHRVGEDIPDACVSTMYNLLNQISRMLNGHVQVIAVSGRDEVCRAETEAWLEKHCGGLPSNLFMRPQNDFRKDSIVKREIYERDILPFYNVIGVFDDRDQVVRELRSMGIKVFQVEEGNF